MFHKTTVYITDEAEIWHTVHVAYESSLPINIDQEKSNFIDNKQIRK